MKYGQRAEEQAREGDTCLKEIFRFFFSMNLKTNFHCRLGQDFYNRYSLDTSEASLLQKSLGQRSSG